MDDDTLRSAVRAKNQAYQRLDRARRLCYERQYRTRTPTGYGDLPADWVARVAVLEGEYDEAASVCRLAFEVREREA